MRLTKQLLLVLLVSWCSSVSGQFNYRTKDPVYLFWQEGTKISYADYKGPAFPNNIPVTAEIGTWTALDLPEKPGTNSKDPIHFYIAPVCDRSASHADSNDSILIAVSNIYFDICEVCARAARKKISALADTLKPASVLSPAFKLLVKEMHENRLRMNRKFYRDFFRNKNKDALNTWRSKLDNDLKSMADWGTKPVDCYRFILGAPVEKGYVEDLSANAVVLRDNYEQVLAPDTWHAGFNQPSRLKTPKK